tara:strand:- start:955 stop:1788 length:834 start_codon:yes stop_codon:yes gene_type:complete
MKMKKNPYDDLTKKVIDMLETAETDWEKPWKAIPQSPKNPCTERMYRGINQMFLTFGHDFSSPYWAGYKQWKSIGGSVRKGEKGSTVVQYSPFTVQIPPEEGGGEKVIPYLRKMAPVFNSEQVENWSPEINQITEEERHSYAENFFHKLEAKIQDGTTACYIPSSDTIEMPPFSAFESGTDYYSTLFHECIHWTGHSTRQNRKSSYAFEELVAELGSIFLLAELGIQAKPQPANAKYLAGWLKLLKDNPKSIILASKDARKAAEYCISKAKGEDEKI